MSWKPTIKTYGDPKFYQNGMAFATMEEAGFWGKDRLSRWMGAEKSGAVESTDPVNYKIDLETGEMTSVTQDSQKSA
jgi:hypothetical protein